MTILININGYTDNTGDDADNVQLSKDKAKTAQRVIIALGIDDKRSNFDGFNANIPYLIIMPKKENSKTGGWIY